MKKIFSLALAFVMLTAIFVPTVSFASLQYGANNAISVTFDSMTENTAVSKTAITGAGTNANYTPVAGLFGKPDSGKSLKIERLASTGSAELKVTNNTNGAALVPTSGYPISKGQMICVNWNWAFGDFNTERRVNASFYNTTGYKWNVVDSYSYSGSTKRTDILTVAPNGSIVLFGKTLPGGYYFDLNRWYNFEIRITQGEATVTSGGEIVKAGEKAVAALYVDGNKIGEKPINNAADSSTTISQIYGIYSLAIGTSAMGKNGLADVTYIDDLQLGYFKRNANSEYFRYLTDINGNVKNLGISSKSDNFIMDNLGQIALKNPMTVAELSADLAYTSGQNTGFYVSPEIVDDKYATVSDTSATVQPGWYIRVQISSNSHSHIYYRKIVDKITYFKNEFDGNTSYTSIPGMTHSKGYVGSVVKYERFSDNGLKENNAFYGGEAYAKVSSAITQIQMIYNTPTYQVPYDKYVFESSFMMKNPTGTMPTGKIVLNNRTLFSVEANGNATLTGLDNTWPVYSENGYDKWYHVALEVDKTAGTSKVYVNGKYTGITYNYADEKVNEIKYQINDYTSAEDLGGIYVDNIRLYSGEYKAYPLEVESSDSDITPEVGEIITVAGDISVADFKASTGAVSVYSYADRAFGSEVTSGNVADGNIAVFKNSEGIVRYLCIKLLPVFNEISFDTSVDGKITANVSYENRSATRKITSGMLVIANRTADEVKLVDLDKKDDTSDIGIYDYSATVDYANGDNVVAYFWDGDLTPFGAAKPYTAQ